MVFVTNRHPDNNSPADQDLSLFYCHACIRNPTSDDHIPNVPSQRSAYHHQILITVLPPCQSLQVQLAYHTLQSPHDQLRYNGNVVHKIHRQIREEAVLFDGVPDVHTHQLFSSEADAS